MCGGTPATYAKTAPWSRQHEERPPQHPLIAHAISQNPILGAQDMPHLERYRHDVKLLSLQCKLVPQYPTNPGVHRLQTSPGMILQGQEHEITRLGEMQ